MTDNTENAGACCTANTTALVAPPAAARTFAPRVDVIETEGAVLLYADLPGVRADQIDLSFERGELTLSGKVAPRETKGRPFFQEYDLGDFQRIFQLNDSIDASKIDAEFKHGVLTVRLPKLEPPKPRQVPIHVQA